jgi:hypothetical protein
MTMIKDLVTVTVENVFRNFLIDEERYELLDVVDQISRLSMFAETPRSDFPIENERIKAFIGGVSENFSLGAVSLLRVTLAYEDPGQIPAIVLDRARRCAMSMDPLDRGYDWGLSARQNACIWVSCLWDELGERLREAHTFRQPSHSDMELQS